MIKLGISVFVALLFGTPAYAGELQARRELKLQVNHLLVEDQFAELERLAADFRINERRTESGLWKLSVFYSEVYENGKPCRRRAPCWSGVEAKMQRWSTAYPKSPVPPIAQALTLMSHAWAIRGGGWSSTVREEDWKPYYELIEKARLHLLENKSLSAQDPRWFEAMLGVAKSQGWEQARFTALVDEAVGLHPYYYQIYFSAIDYLLPKWHGDKRKVEEFANFAVQKTRPREGTAMYARIYWYASQSQYGSRLFTDSDVVWPRMKKGIEDVLARYPDQWNLNNFAQFACQAKDRAFTAALIRRVEAPPLPDVWDASPGEDQDKQPLKFEACKAWATSR